MKVSLCQSKIFLTSEFIGGKQVAGIRNHIVQCLIGTPLEIFPFIRTHFLVKEEEEDTCWISELGHKKCQLPFQ